MPWFSQVRQKPLAHWFHTSTISVSKMQTWRSGWYTCHLGQYEMSRSGIFDEEIRHLMRLCLREAGSSIALIFKFHTLASDSDAICNFFWKKMEVFEILHCVSYRTPKLSLSFLAYSAASKGTKHIYMQRITSTYLAFSSELHARLCNFWTNRKQVLTGKT